MAMFPQNNDDPQRDDSRIIAHFDYDCFYASVFEAENPALKSLPLAVQQKQIVVTCNYEARRRGLRKLQLIKDAKRICPDVVIVLGEDLTKFRDASKNLATFLGGFVWEGRVEKLGFDEVFLDVSPMIDYNIQVLNHNDLRHSFFQLDKSDPTVGFPFDATRYCGPTYPAAPHGDSINPEGAPLPVKGPDADVLGPRLVLGSHLANHIRMQLEEKCNFTATVGVSTSKLLSKLVGNVHKPRSQTTLVPPYAGDGSHGSHKSNVISFLDDHDIGKIPGIGFKITQRLRSYVLGREPKSELYEALPEGDRVTVAAIRECAGIGPLLLDDILRGRGLHRDIGTKVWDLLNGVDTSEVALARTTPTQISIEDSYGQLESLEDVQNALVPLTGSLIKRMRTDLTEVENDTEDNPSGESTESKFFISKRRRWIAHPRTLRLSTRARLPRNPDGTPNFSAPRVSRSCSMPQFVFSLSENVDVLVERLVREVLVSTFRKLHPERSGWKLSLINVAATNMADAAGDAKTSAGRDIGKMFRTQERVLREWKVEDQDLPPEGGRNGEGITRPQTDVDMRGSGWETVTGYGEEDTHWESDEEYPMPSEPCRVCGMLVPHLAVKAHETYHSLPD